MIRGRFAEPCSISLILQSRNLSFEFVAWAGLNLLRPCDQFQPQFNLKKELGRGLITITLIQPEVEAPIQSKLLSNSSLLPIEKKKLTKDTAVFRLTHATPYLLVVHSYGLRDLQHSIIQPHWPESARPENQK